MLFVCYTYPGSILFQWYVLLQVPPLFLNVQPDHHILDSMLSISFVHDILHII